MVLTDEEDLANRCRSMRNLCFGQGNNRFVHEGLGCNLQPVLRRRGLFSGESYPVAERIARRGFYLPSGLALTSSQQERVCAAVHEVLA